ncbi:DUF417 family protein [Pseudomonas sp.]|uniref:DUF417 family protein n=1 Tax=Pseudomonas sp. TaxID=306 RepID=UPI003A97740D
MTNNLSRFGFYVALYGTVFVVVWNGFFKFEAEEAMSVSELLKHSPFFAWMYNFGNVQGVSNVIGVGELFTALLLALYPFSKKASLLGGLLGIGLFLTTLTFLFSTPGILNEDSIFPSLFGAFLIKDWVLLGVSISVVGDSLTAIKQ